MPSAPGVAAEGVGAGAAEPRIRTTTFDRLPYVPALDTLRAVAVTAVLVYHHDPGRVPGGWLGVSLFFTLSGFLVAGLLLAEHADTGRIDLRSFWVRRVRRLLPASLIALGLALLVLTASPIHRSPSALPDIRAAVLNIANWRFVAADVAYGVGGPPSPVQHYWSLAIEEQFYLVLPLVTLVALRFRILGWVVAAGVALSLALQVGFDHGVDRTYFGTDTRAAELGVGVALALALPAVRQLIGDRTWIADAWGAVAVAACGVLFVGVHLSEVVVGSGALTAVTVVWVGLLVASVCGRWFPALVGRGPLPALGRISYGVYLYHWPVYLLTTPSRTGLDGATLLALRFIVTIALAAASSALVEVPIRRGLVVRHRVLPVAFAAVALVVVATALPVVPDRAPNRTLAGGVLIAPPPPASPTERDAGAPTTSSTTIASAGAPPASQVAAGERAAGAAATDPDPQPSAQAAVAPPAPKALPRLLVVGDSTAGGAGLGLQTVGARDGRAEVFVLQAPGCVVLPYEMALARPGFEYRTTCGDILAEAAKLGPELDVDAIVVFIGSLQLADARYAGLDGLRTILDEEVGARYRDELTNRLDGFRSTGIPVLWADVPVPAWDLDQMGESHGQPIEGAGPATANDPARAGRLNEIDADVMRHFPGAVRWSYVAALAGPDGKIEPGLRYDGLHIDSSVAERLSRETIFAQLEAAYRTVRGRIGSENRTVWDS